MITTSPEYALCCYPQDCDIVVPWLCILEFEPTLAGLFLDGNCPSRRRTNTADGTNIRETVIPASYVRPVGTINSLRSTALKRRQKELLIYNRQAWTRDYAAAAEDDGKDDEAACKI